MTKSTLDKIIAALLSLRSVATDEQAIEAVALYPEWKADAELCTAGDRVRYNDKLYRVLQTHKPQAGWAPSDAPSLFAEILPGQDGTDVGPWERPDSTNPYMTGDRVLWTDGHIYESLIDNNVWSPDEYTAGWRMVD